MTFSSVNRPPWITPEIVFIPTQIKVIRLYILPLIIYLSPPRINQINRSLLLSVMPLAHLNLTAIYFQSSGLCLRRISKANGSCCWPGDNRLLLLLPFSTNRFSILEPQWHLGEPLARGRYLEQKILITLWATAQRCCQLQKTGLPLTDAISIQSAVVTVVAIEVIKYFPYPWYQLIGILWFY